MNSVDDKHRVQRAAFTVGLSVGIASAVIITLGVGALVAFILLTSRHEADEHRGGLPGDEVVVDVDRILPAVIVMGVLGVLLMALVAWIAARRSVRPLGEALRRQRNFVADASHELRTPLTTLTSRIQILQRRNERGEPIESSITDLRGDAGMMSDVLNDLLLAAEGSIERAAEPTPVAAAIASALESLQPVADEASVALAMTAPDAGAVSLPRVTLVRVLVALLDNAVQHSPAGGTVLVAASRQQDAVAIRVSDEGPGITGIRPEDVFERFARSGETGRRRSFGLGLSLVRDVALRAGGSVDVEQTSSAGTTFLVTLPAL
ncbi:signal transduction histidine kinase [Microbacterium endophyticum]|uniref:histidine kinase n=1 Tax=Microbacterium endophyticum TaxID=1526412 RepID=A0A7W4YLI0_9MICO|nr:HAMP domain-containing sensor histidine kinase [Microbacterium endophyticum]MBB2975188.1 signal transduction histidine kinase [Microbacterium endophyticum]NIK37600.1 signal transduction histidine kinase [Microbacterium endophyticum]